MRKRITMFLAFWVLATAGGLTTSCATRTPQQKKTASFKRKAKGGHVPCPCDSH